MTTTDGFWMSDGARPSSEALIPEVICSEVSEAGRGAPGGREDTRTDRPALVAVKDGANARGGASPLSLTNGAHTETTYATAGADEARCRSEAFDHPIPRAPSHGILRREELRSDAVSEAPHVRRGSALLAAVPRVELGGLEIAVTGRAAAAEMLLDLAIERRGTRVPPAIITSANGQVLSLCARDRQIQKLFRDCDLIHADGMPLVFASYMRRGGRRLPERVATTDLFHDVAGLASRRGGSFYLLGCTPEGVDRAAANVRRMYPGLVLLGAHHGYLEGAEEEDQIRRIAELQPDVLWIGMGVPREQRFAHRWRSALVGVGVIKTGGGLFDFLSGAQRRAPTWMQQSGLEWLYRTWREPQRLMMRYILTNPHALYLLLKRGD